MTDAREYLRAGDIARLSGASVRTVRRWIKEILPSTKVRGMRLVPREAVERLLSPGPFQWDDPDDET
jgi:excisionase family DNA binding protein